MIYTIQLKLKRTELIKKNDICNDYGNKHRKLLICIYTNKDRNEFAIGLKEDENFRAMTKIGEFYTRFVDAFDDIVVMNEKENRLETDIKEIDCFCKGR